MKNKIKHGIASPIRYFHIKLLALAIHPLSKKNRRTYRARIRQRWFLKFAPEALGTLSDLINKSHFEVDVWLEFGTLLGAYREHDIINHDNDIDLGISDSPDREAFISHLENFGFRLISKFRLRTNEPHLDGRIVEYKLSYRSLLTIDFFVAFSSSDNKICYYCFDAERGLTWKQTMAKYNGMLRTHIWTVNAFTLCAIQFLGGTWKIPKNAPQHLAEIYGANFMTPVVYSFSDRPLDREVLLPITTMGEMIST